MGRVDPLNDRFERLVAVRIHDDIEVLLDLTGLDLIVADIGIWNPGLIEPHAKPTGVFGVVPGVHHRQPGQIEGVPWNVGCGGSGGEVEGQLGRHFFQGRPKAVLRTEDPRPGRVIRTVVGERGLGHLDLERRKAMAGGQHLLLAGVTKDKYRPPARHRAGVGNIRSHELRGKLPH